MVHKFDALGRTGGVRRKQSGRGQSGTYVQHSERTVLSVRSTHFQTVRTVRLSALSVCKDILSSTCRKFCEVNQKHLQADSNQILNHLNFDFSTSTFADQFKPSQIMACAKSRSSAEMRFLQTSKMNHTELQSAAFFSKWCIDGNKVTKNAGPPGSATDFCRISKASFTLSVDGV